MRRWIVVMLGSLGLSCLGLMVCRTVHACTCMPTDTSQSYEQAEHVVHVRIRRALRHDGGRRFYRAVLLDDDFKGCLTQGHEVIIETASSSAVCGVSLTPGQGYLLYGRESGSSYGSPILNVGLCAANALWTELSAEQLTFLRSRYVCCDGACTCSDGSQPVQCLVDPCTVSTCAVEGSECRANYCGGCNAEWHDPTGLQVCQDAPPACRIAGCSGELCIEPGAPGVSTCEWRPEYACYQQASCELQENGACDWTLTPELSACLANAVLENR
jgi:hypothetical protein